MFRAGQFLVIAWAVLAIYYSNLPWAWGRVVLAVALAAFSVWSLWVTARRRMRWAFLAALAAVIVWWVCIPPLQDRPWRPEVSVLPRAIIDGDNDRVRLTGFRRFAYRSRDDFDPRWEMRELRISHIAAVDFFISYWRIGPVGHTFVSFDFDDGTPPVCISIECRAEIGEGFSPLPSMFKQYELFYVVGDERDIVRVRTEFRGEDVFCYRTRMTPAQARRLFRVYLARVNELAERPEWYHLLSNNCTLNILRYTRRAGVPRARLDFRHLLNGLIDRYLYGSGAINTDLPFDELRRRSWINDAANAAGDADDFSARIRASLPFPTPN